ncbi:TraV family lipoprotein [Desulfurobacterium crinifex]
MRKILVLIAAAVALASCSSNKLVKTAPPEPSVKERKEIISVVPEFKAKPIYVPPEVVRVLIMPYEDDQGVLHQGEFVYFTLKPGYWTIATKGEVQRIKKMVRIVQTQKGLGSPSVTPEVLPISEEKKTPAPKKLSSPQESSCGPDCQRKLAEIKRYTEKK